MKKRILSAVLLLILCCAWAASALAAMYGTVYGGWLRLRAQPSYSATIITSYPTGTVVTVLSRSNGWCRVLTGDYRTGYMDEHYLHLSGSAPDPTPDPSGKRVWTTVNRTAYVTSQNGKGVRLRSSPEVNNYNILGLYPVGRTVTELRRSNDGWSYIRIDGKYGYMMSEFLTGSGVIPPGGKITDIRLNITKPRVGDTLKVTVTPAGASFSVVWYNEASKLLGTSQTYKVKSSDLGTKILVRVTGSDGTVLKTKTKAVQEALKDVGGDLLNDYDADPSSVSEGTTDSFTDDSKLKPKTETKPEATEKPEKEEETKTAEEEPETEETTVPETKTEPEKEPEDEFEPETESTPETESAPETEDDPGSEEETDPEE